MTLRLRSIAHCSIALSSLLIGAGAQAQTRDETDIEKVSRENGSAEFEAVAIPDAAAQIASATNKFRQEQGLSPVEVDPALRDAARYFSQYMAKTSTYGHGADGKHPAERATQHGYNYCIVAENIAYAYSSRGYQPAELAERFTSGWKESPEHRENMLDPDVIQTGVAVAESGDSGYYYAVQMFGRPASERIEFRVANRSAHDVTYKIGDRSFPLGPRYIRTHERCRPTELVIDSTVRGNSLTFHPNEGQTVAIEQTDGKLSAKVE